MKVELLAPGGSFESVIAAYNAGADAVYTGGLMFGARAGANNLTTEELIEALEYAHVHDRKLYLTVNTLLKDKEIETELDVYKRQAISSATITSNAVTHGVNGAIYCVDFITGGGK